VREKVNQQSAKIYKSFMRDKATKQTLRHDTSRISNPSTFCKEDQSPEISKHFLQISIKMSPLFE